MRSSEVRTTREKLGFYVAEGLLALSLLAACTTPPQVNAYTNLTGIVYLNGSENNPDTVKHEKCHWKRAQEEKIGFFVLYTLDGNFACQEELRCGESLEHPSCNRSSLEIDNIFPLVK